MSEQKSKLGEAYQRVYGALCGKHPEQRPWHFQWLGTRWIRKSFAEVLPTCAGRVLDVGCGTTPYRDWFAKPSEYVGLDIKPGPSVDVVVPPGERWPLEDGGFDVVFASQVLEHVEDLDHVKAEIDRVLKPGGLVILSVPFIYNEHSVPFDFRRFSRHSAPHLMPAYEVLRVDTQGGVGSSTASLFLNWVDDSMNLTRATRLMKGVLLPLWVVVAALVNGLAVVVDRIDRTDRYYGNVMVVLQKPLEAGAVAQRERA